MLLRLRLWKVCERKRTETGMGRGDESTGCAGFGIFGHVKKLATCSRKHMPPLML